jgi:hypothetical protein
MYFQPFFAATAHFRKSSSALFLHFPPAGAAKPYQFSKPQIIQISKPQNFQSSKPFFMVQVPINLRFFSRLAKPQNLNLKKLKTSKAQNFFYAASSNESQLFYGGLQNQHFLHFQFLKTGRFSDSQNQNLKRFIEKSKSKSLPSRQGSATLQRFCTAEAPT